MVRKPIGSAIHLAYSSTGPHDMDDPGYFDTIDSGGQPDAIPGANHPAAAVDLTEDGMALAFCADQNRKLVFDHTEGQWYYWAGHRWLRDETSLAFDTARDFVRDIKQARVDPPAALSKIGFVEAIIKAAKADRHMAVSHDVWDTDPWILGVPGGVVDLKTGEMRPCDPGEFVSKQAAVAPAPPGTPTPMWSAFLKAATRDDPEVIAFLQRLAGYILTGDVTEEMLTFLYGPGGNGKGVFMGALVDILADYGVSVPIGVFTASSNLNLEYYRAKMFGARMVTASETEAGEQWAESEIKELTGNEAPISARNPYGRPFSFRAQFKVMIVGNHAPKLKGRNPAMERRLRIVPFLFAPAKPDPTLKERMRAEYPAILRWMIEGCLQWQKNRLGNASAIQIATSEYFDQQDVFRRWIEDRCIVGKDFAGNEVQDRPGSLSADFISWAKANGEDPVSAPEFSEMLLRWPGVAKAVIRGKRWIRGIARKADEAQPSWHDRD